MKKFSKILMISIIAVFLAAGSALAAPVYTDGTDDLVDVFDSLGLTAAGYDVVTSQQTIPYWTHSAVGVLSSFVFTDVNTFWGVTAEFGIFSSATNQLVPLFTQTHQGSTAVTFLADGSIDVFGSGGYSVLPATTPGFGSNFGFYITSDGGFSDDTYYSDTTMNPPWTPTWYDSNTYYDWMLFYQGAEGVQLNPYGNFAGGFFGQDDWLIAADGYTHNGPASLGRLDFNDTVILVESVRPVPIPPAALLLASGLLGLIGIRRFKNRG